MISLPSRGSFLYNTPIHESAILFFPKTRPQFNLDGGPLTFFHRLLSAAK